MGAWPARVGLRLPERRARRGAVVFGVLERADVLAGRRCAAGEEEREACSEAWCAELGGASSVKARRSRPAGEGAMATAALMI